MGKVRIMHYLNQFFAGMGGEDKIDAPLEFKEEVLGPGRLLQSLLQDSAEIVVTACCGDNYFAYNTDKVLNKILNVARDHKVDIVVAGPAFAAGRYGFACSEVCQYLSASEEISGVTGMYTENPGVDGYKQYKNKKVFLIPTSDAVKDMQEVLANMAQLLIKLASGAVIGSASEEGYFPRGIRVDKDAEKIGADRAIEMLLDKMAGRPFETEVPYEGFEEYSIPAPITDMENATIAIASTTGLTTAGNPYNFKMARNTQFQKYDVGKSTSMKESKWDVIHAGYGATFMIENPDSGAPLDALRVLEKDRVIGKISPNFYGTTGVEGAISEMEAIGRGMAEEMKAEGVNGVLMVST
jgi:betaine reductase